MADQKEKPKFNSTFTKVNEWKSDESKERYVVVSWLTNNDTGQKKLFINEQGKDDTGKPYSKKGTTFPPKLASAIGDALKIIGAGVSN